jgi:hypothetical protein
MPTQLAKPVEVSSQGWAGGVNIRDAVNQLGPDQARRMENGILDEKGGFSKRLGCVANGTVGAGADRIISQYTFYRGAANPPQVLAHTSAGNLYYTADPSANPVVWTLIASGFSTTQPMSFETFNSKCYFCDGVSAYASWTGTTYTTYASAPKGKYLRLWKDTMWISGVTGLDDRVYSSSPGDAETFPVASWVDIAKGDGDTTKALGTDGLFLIVGKRNRIMLIYDPVTFANRVIDFEKGIESHWSIIQMEGTIYFLTRRGICKYLQDSPGEFLSMVLDPMFDPAILNLAALDKSWAYAYGNRVCWALPESGSTVNSVQVEYYPRLGRLTQYGIRGIGPWAFNRMPVSTFTRWRWNTQDLLFGGAQASNKFMQLYAPIGTDDGASFVAILETPAYDFGVPTRTKYLRRIRLLGRGRFTIQFKPDYKSAVSRSFAVDLTSTTNVWNVGNWNVGNWGPDSLFKEDRIDTDDYARAFSMVFLDGDTGVGRKLVEVGSREFSVTEGEWGLYGVMLEGTVLGVRD